MTQIWKQELEVTDLRQYLLPKGAKLLDVQVQNGKPCLWFEFEKLFYYSNDTDVPITERWDIMIIGTGHKFSLNPDNKKGFNYFRTFQMLEGRLVFHVYTRK